MARVTYTFPSFLVFIYVFFAVFHSFIHAFFFFLSQNFISGMGLCGTRLVSNNTPVLFIARSYLSSGFQSGGNA